MKKIIVIALCIVASQVAQAGSYQYEADKQDMCSKIGGYAQLTLKQAMTGGEPTNMSQRAGVGHLRPLFAYVEQSIARNPAGYDQKSAYMAGWGYCMDRIEDLDREHTARSR